MKLSLSLTVSFIGYVLCICPVCVIGGAGQANIDVSTNGITAAADNVFNRLQRKNSKRNFEEVFMYTNTHSLLYPDEPNGRLSLSYYCGLNPSQENLDYNWAIWTVEDVNLAEQKLRLMIQTQNIGWQCLGHEQQVVQLTKCSNDDSVWQNKHTYLCHNQECLATDGENFYLQTKDAPWSLYSTFLQYMDRSFFPVGNPDQYCRG